MKNHDPVPGPRSDRDGVDGEKRASNRCQGKLDACDGSDGQTLKDGHAIHQWQSGRVLAKKPTPVGDVCLQTFQSTLPLP